MKKTDKLYNLICISRCKNEIHGIEKWINHLRPIVDLFCIVDNGSSDGTYSRLKQQKDVVVTQTIGFHESRDLTLALDLAKAHKAKWILKLDCDEFFEKFAILNFNMLLNQNKFMSFAFRKYHFIYRLADSEFRYDGRYLGTIKNPEVKLSRLNKDLNYPWVRSHSGDFLFFGFPLALSSFRIKHYSMPSEKKAKEKYDNYLLIREKNDKNNYSNLIDIRNEPISSMSIGKFDEPLEINSILPLSGYGLKQYIVSEYSKITIQQPKRNFVLFKKILTRILYLTASIIPFGNNFLIRVVEKKISRA